MPQKPFVVYSLKHFGQNLRCDPRTAAARIAKLQIEPFAISVTGEAFFLEDALRRLEAAELEPEVAPAEASP
jgi:hypothetical protein